MTAKRKKNHGVMEKDDFAAFLKQMRETLGEEQFDAIAQEILNPKLLTEEELRDADMLNFSNSIHELPASLEPPVDFALKWESLLDWHEEKERQWLSRDTGKPHAGDRLVQRRWAVLNRERNAYDYLERLPAPELYPIPIIVVNWHGTWDLSPSLRDTVIQHPIYRALAATLPESNPQGSLQDLMKWAASLSVSAEANEETMAQLALRFEDVIHDGIHGGSTDEEWLRSAKESRRFWLLLQIAFDFGDRYSIWRTYRDGTLSKASRKGLLNPGGKSSGEWGKNVNRLYEQYVQEVGTKPTPSQLFSWLGGVRHPKDDNIPLRFENPKGSILNGILWNEFVNRVDVAKK